MTQVTLSARVGPDGVLHLPLGAARADQEVQVTIQPLEHEDAVDQAEYLSWVESMAGSWQGDFERPPQSSHFATLLARRASEWFPRLRVGLTMHWHRNSQ